MQISLFAEATPLERISQLGDSMERLKVIDFEKFRPTLLKSLKKERKSNVGRPAYDSVMDRVNARFVCSQYWHSSCVLQHRLDELGL